MDHSSEDTDDVEKDPLVTKIRHLHKELSSWLQKCGEVEPSGHLIHLIVDVVLPNAEANDAGACLCLASMHELDESTKVTAFHHLINHCNVILRASLMRQKCDCPSVGFQFSDDKSNRALIPLAHMLKIKAISGFPFNKLIGNLTPMNQAPDPDVSAHMCVRLTYTSAVLMRLLLTATDESKSQMATRLIEDRDITPLLLKLGAKLLKGKENCVKKKKLI